MLILRDEQMRALARPGREAFEARLVANVEERFPDTCRSLGGDGTRKAVELAVTRAEGYGLETDRDVTAYVTLTFTFGRDFDRDPSLPWAAATLAVRPVRMDQLHAGALEHLAEARGLDAPPSDGGRPGAPSDVD
jgi:hypothetical protein